MPENAVVGLLRVSVPRPSLAITPAPAKTPVAAIVLATWRVPAAAAVRFWLRVRVRVPALMPVMVVPAGMPVPTTTWPLASPVTSATTRLLVLMRPLVMALSSCTFRRAVAPARTLMSPVVAPAQPVPARSVPVRTKVPPVWVREPPAVMVRVPARTSS